MFENEYTWGKAIEQNKQDEFDSKFESAVDSVKQKFGGNYPNIINGKEVYSEDKIAVKSPADTTIVLGNFPKLDSNKTIEAIKAAKDAFPIWSNIDYQERSKIFKKVADKFSQKKFELAVWLSFENGKNRIEAMNDVDEAIDFMRFYSYQLEKNKGFCFETPHPNPKEKTMSVLRPYGVWGIISPFNFPSAIAIGMTTGALLTGNTAVLKPASAAPFSSYFFVQDLLDMLPPGSINFLTGDGSEVGRALIENSDVDGIAFTGSYEVGMSGIRKFTGERIKPFIAEMGGKNPVIVTKNANLEKAANGVMKAAFGYGGQKCSACSRVYVQKEVKDKFIQKLVENTKTLKVGKPWEKDCFLGPLINKDALKKFSESVDIAKKDGKIILGGNQINDSEFSSGFFVEPTIVVDLPKDHKLITQELFLPLLCIDTYDDFQQAIDLANKTEYGLTAGIFSEDSEQVEEFFRKIQAGTVYANREASATTAALVQSQPFVGWKSSGSTGKGAGGQNYLQQFMRAQTQTRCD